ncbi:MAG: glycosyltransferase family 39 protein [Desulfobacterales bacterium]|nr:glycosyltransferase family 39 protein [Desulfobacterales bacterium]
MKLKNLLIRLLFCMLFVAVVFYAHSYKGELINNAQVQWQYVENSEGELYLALDVYAPSGVKIAGIFLADRDITDCWQLINYPDWYKGRENFDKLSEFQDVLHPYLPFNKDFDILYTAGWYTFLYKWNPSDSLPNPPENSIEVRYQNTGTQNYYDAKYALGARIISEIAGKTVDSPVVDLQILYPSSSDYKYSGENKLGVVLDNLIPGNSSSSYVLEDTSRDDYGVCVRNRTGEVVDSLKGFVKWDSEKAYQVYLKTDCIDRSLKSIGHVDFHELLRHIVAIIFIVYFVLICRYAGMLFVRWRGIVLDGHSEKLFIPTFLGIIFLTYLFFGVGILKLLYFPVLFVVLLVLLFFGYESSKEAAFYIKEGLRNEFNKIRKSPWRIIFLSLLAFMLFYNLSYCFVPATYVDGSGDIVNSYLPNLNDYVLSHSFKAPIQNSTNGIASQAIDVLRAVVMVFIGKSGVYLLSFIYLLLVLAGVYLIGKELFGINSILIYLTALLFLSGNLFTESLHLGKLYVAILSFLLIALYSICFSEHKKNYIIAALFWGFLTSQLAFFIVPALVYYLFVFGCYFKKKGTTKKSIFNQHIKSLIVFSVLCTVFNLKLILEVGTCFSPGMISINIADFFSGLNRSNDLYKYIDNDYIRHFYRYHLLSMNQHKVPLLKSIELILRTIRHIDFAYIFLFAPFLLVRLNRCRTLYILETLAIVWFIGYLLPGNERVKVYYIFPLVILQFAVVNDFISGVVINRFFKAKELDFIFKLDGQTLRLSSVPSFAELINKFNQKGRLYIILNFKNSKFRLDKMIDRFFSLKVAFAIMLFLMLPFFIFKDFPKGFFAALPDDIKIRKFQYARRMGYVGDHRCLQRNQPEQWFFREVLPVFIGKKTKYEYLHTGDSHLNFDHSMLIRQYTDVTDKILIVPVRFHSHAMRNITARHALGSVIYQKDITQIMKDLKKLNINYFSYVPIHYEDYNPFYTPIFEEDIFFKYFKLLFSDNGRKFYEIVYNGTNTQYHKSPYDVTNLPFVPMIKAGV